MFENIRLSLQGIITHKVRSLLTMLGIIIGIAAIIAIVSTIKGTNEQIKNNLVGAGNNTVNIYLYSGEYPLDFSYEDIPDNVGQPDEKIREEIEKADGAEEVSFFHMRTYDTSVYYNTTNYSGDVYGIDDKYFDTTGLRIKKGRGILKNEYSKGLKVAVIDETAEKTLFLGEDPVGKVIEIGREPFTVVGVAMQSTKFEPVIESMEDYMNYHSTSGGKIYLADKAWPLLHDYDEPVCCVVRADSTDSMPKVGQAASEIMNKLIPDSGSEEETEIKYKSENLLEQAKSLQKISGSTNMMLVWIAGISLLVGGIGVMNIMLVSVTERTREIGLKKAIGAKKSRILAQFLTESAVLTSIGGIIGVICGIILSKVISKVMSVPVAVSTMSIVVAVAFSMFVGIIFGLIPSVKASNLDPIEALRYE